MAEPYERLDMAERTCKIDGCERPYCARGLCNTHYVYERKHGRLAEYERERDSTRACAAEGCERTVKRGGRGLCSSHYQRLRVSGEVRPDVPLRQFPCAGLSAAEVIARFVDRRGPDECWPWTGTIDKNGYGAASCGGNIAAYRLAFLVANGRLPVFSVDHTCHDARSCVPYGRGSECPHRRCCNPAHLADIPLPENTRRRGDYPTCAKGHPWTPENTWLRPSGTRRCRECERAYW